MKKLFALLLLLSLVLALAACAQEEAPSLRYDAQAAYYEEAEAELSMELSFAQAVAAGSEIKLLDGQTEVFSVTSDSALTSLTIRSSKLQRNVPYTLTVNGITQQHDSIARPPAVGEITIPEQPTVPVEPMGETLPTEATEAGGFTPGAGSQTGGAIPGDAAMEKPGRMPSGETGEQPTGEAIPPESMSGEQPPEGFGEMVPPESMGGELPSEGFGGKQPPEGDILAERSALTFMLTSQNNSFNGVRDAVTQEGKEPNS